MKPFNLDDAISSLSKREVTAIDSLIHVKPFKEGYKARVLRYEDQEDCNCFDNSEVRARSTCFVNYLRLMWNDTEGLYDV